MSEARVVLNQKLSIESWLKPKLLNLHKKVLNDILKRENVNLLRYKQLYIKLLSNANKRINKVDDVKIYNGIFINQSVDNILLSFQEFLSKKDFPVVKSFTIQDEVPIDGINEAILLLPLKAARDSQVFVQQNYERQNLVNNISQDDNEENTEEEVALAILSNQVINTTKKKRWNDVDDVRVRVTHSHADGQIRGIDEPFIIGGFQLMYPGDPSLGAPFEIWINCRCFLTYI